MFYAQDEFGHPPAYQYPMVGLRADDPTYALFSACGDACAWYAVGQYIEYEGGLLGHRIVAPDRAGSDSAEFYVYVI